MAASTRNRQQAPDPTLRLIKPFAGGEKAFVAGCSQTEEIRRKEKGGGESGRKKGRGRSPLQYALGQDEVSAHRRKPRGRREEGTGRKSGERAVVFLYPTIDDEDYGKKEKNSTTEEEKREDRRRTGDASGADTLHVSPRKREPASAPQQAEGTIPKPEPLPAGATAPNPSAVENNTQL